jgi:hypothetical protein
MSKTGIIAIIGKMKLARYRLFEQKNPVARFGKLLIFPSFTKCFDPTFRPDMQSELSNL